MGIFIQPAVDRPICRRKLIIRHSAVDHWLPGSFSGAAADFHCSENIQRTAPQTGIGCSSILDSTLWNHRCDLPRRSDLAGIQLFAIPGTARPSSICMASLPGQPQSGETPDGC